LMTIMPPTMVNIARERNFFFSLWFIGKSSALEVVSCRRGLALARPEAGRGHADRQRWTSETRVHPVKPPLSLSSGSHGGSFLCGIALWMPIPELYPGFAGSKASPAMDGGSRPHALAGTALGYNS